MSVVVPLFDREMPGRWMLREWIREEANVMGAHVVYKVQTHAQARRQVQIYADRCVVRAKMIDIAVQYEIADEELEAAINAWTEKVTDAMKRIRFRISPMLDALAPLRDVIKAAEDEAAGDIIPAYIVGAIEDQIMWWKRRKAQRPT